MKTKHFLPALMSVLACATPSADAVVIAYWNFNSLTTSTNNGATYSPTSGSASLTLNGWTSTGTAGITSFGGSTINALNSDVSGQALSLQGGAGTGTPNNGATLVFEFSTVGLEDPILSFATQRTTTGFNSNQVAYSIDGVNYTDFGTAYNPATSFGLQTFDFSSINALDNDSSVFVRITFTGATANAGNNRLDNIQITAVPEPASVLLGSLGLLAMLRRRR